MIVVVVKKKNQNIKFLSKSLYILSETESEELYGLPKFSEEERIIFFTLNPEEELILNELIYNHSKIHFILQLGYFKAKHRLFNFTATEVIGDANYVISKYFSKESTECIIPIIPSRKIQTKNNNKILTLMGYNKSEHKAITMLRERTKILVKSLSNPHIIFREILIYFDLEKVILPGRNVIQNVIGKAIVCEAKRLEALIIKTTPKKIIKLLNNLLDKKTINYEITKLKQEPKNFNFNQTQKEITKHNSYYAIYKFSKKLLPTLNISQQNIEYYGSLAIHYNRYQLNNFKKEKTYLYLLCYIHYRFQKMNDQFIQTFCYYVDLYNNNAMEYAKHKSGKDHANIQKYLPASGKLLLRDTDLSLSKYRFKKIQEENFKILEREKIIIVAKYMINQSIDKKNYEWEYHGKHLQAILKNLRPIARLIDFQTHIKDEHLLSGIDFIKSACKNKKALNSYHIKEFPLNFISKKLQKYLYTKQGRKKIIHPVRYEFMVYQQLRKHIDTGIIFCDDTIQYKSLESDIKIKHWEQRKHKILKELDNPKLTMPIEERLKELKEQLEPLLKKINADLKNKENKHINFSKKKGKITWSLKYEKKTDLVDNPFYEHLSKVGINEVINFVNQQCGFMQAFTHITTHKQKANPNYLSGGLVANATKRGIRDLSNNSDLKYSILLDTQNDYFRLETLKKASDMILIKAKELPIFKNYDFTPGIHHAARDGRKITTRVENFLSRHSSKYFGVGKGVVSATTIFNNLAINTELMSAHEYEGHYLFDSLFSNFSEIELHRIATDSAGGLQMNHLILDLKNVEFTPCYKSIAKKTALIGTFKKLDDYKDCIIQPTRQFKTSLIIEEHPNFLPILVALFRKETKQSIVVKKLSSYKRKSRVKDALWEYNNILLSIYLSKYISDPKLRQDVRGALNRNEGYNQLCATIESIGGSRNKGAENIGLHLWNECSRLLTNIISYYNGYIFSKFMIKKEEQGKHKAVKFIKKMSTIGSQHINLGGYLAFNTKQTFINVAEIIEQLERIIGELD